MSRSSFCTNPSCGLQSFQKWTILKRNVRAEAPVRAVSLVGDAVWFGKDLSQRYTSGGRINFLAGRIQSDTFIFIPHLPTYPCPMGQDINANKQIICNVGFLSRYININFCLWKIDRGVQVDGPEQAWNRYALRCQSFKYPRTFISDIIMQDCWGEVH